MSLPSDYTNEIQSLNREVLAHNPPDVLQFCANFFLRRLESQRAEFLLHQHYNAGRKGGPNAGMTSNFPGSNPFGSSSRVESPTGGRGMGSVREDDEHDDTVASPTASGFPPNAFSGDGGGSASGTGSDQNKENGSGEARDTFGAGGFGNFDGFGKGGSFGKTGASPGESQNFPSNYNLNRRTSVSAESLNPATSANDNWTPPFHQKTQDQQSRLRAAVAGNFLFSHLDDDQSAQVLGALQEKQIPAKDIKVITQGDVGDYFYVVETGDFDVYVSSTGKVEAGADGVGNKVTSVGPGGSFGELALMYNAPRAASVVSTAPSTLWALDRITFRRILMDSAFQRRRMYESFLEEVKLLSSLTPYERSKIADALETQKYPPGSTIIKEGDRGESFFLLEAGEAQAFKRGVDKPVKTYSKGEYFGELALLNDAPRAASVVSSTEVKVATLGKDGFQRLLGPVEGIMRRNDYSRSQAEEVDPLST